MHLINPSRVHLLIISTLNKLLLSLDSKKYKGIGPPHPPIIEVKPCVCWARIPQTSISSLGPSSRNSNLPQCDKYYNEGKERSREDKMGGFTRERCLCLEPFYGRHGSWGMDERMGCCEYGSAYCRRGCGLWALCTWISSLAYWETTLNHQKCLSHCSSAVKSYHDHGNS